jgi:predicted AlkP superfamily phosphohydrolase/phosphomutase
MRLAATLALVLAPLAACGDGAPDPAPSSAARTPRLLVVGWDGASFGAIDPLLASGDLPNLARLLARGSRAPLASTIVPISSAAWTTATTGRTPGEHGVFAFHAPLPGSYELALVSARSSRAAPLWRLLSGRGLPSIVLGVPLTYPPEPILGTLVGGMLSPPAADFAWPPGVADSLRARGFLPDIEPWLEEREPTLADAEAQIALRAELLAGWLAADDWRLAWIVSKELDVLAHFSYGAELAAHVAPVYRALDALLGTLVAAVGADTDVIVLSDHGFTSYTHGLNLHAWLVGEGFAARRADARDEPLPAGPFARRLAAEHAQRLAELDLAATQAFAWACEGNFGSVRLNLRGREPLGPVTADDAETVLARMEARLFAHPWVVRVWRGAELLPGPERAALPDLLFETEPHVQVFAERGTELAGAYDPSVADHDLLGIFVAAGPSFARGAELGLLALADVAPLALHVLGQPVPQEMDGTVPLALLTGARAVERVPESAFAVLRAPASGPAYTPEEIAELERSLRALGYGD